MDSRLNPFQDKMEKTLNNLEEEYVGIRAGRANPHILDKLRVDYYGTPSPIQSVANVSVPEPRMIQIQPWEASMVANDIKKKGEEAKLAVRNIRRDAIDSIKKNGKEEGISEDEIKGLEDDAQKLTDKFVAKVDAAVDAKCKEILTV